MKWLYRRSTVLKVAADARQRHDDDLAFLDLHVREREPSEESLAAAQWEWIDLGLGAGGAERPVERGRPHEGGDGRMLGSAGGTTDDVPVTTASRTRGWSRSRTSAGRSEGTTPTSSPSSSSNSSPATSFSTAPSSTSSPSPKRRPSILRRRLSLRTPLFSSPHGDPPRPPPKAPRRPSSPPPPPTRPPTPPLVHVKIGVALDSSGRRVLTNRKRLSRDPTASFAPTPVRRVKKSYGIGDDHDSDEETLEGHGGEEVLRDDIEFQRADAIALWDPTYRSTPAPFVPLPTGAPSFLPPPHRQSAILPLRSPRHHHRAPAEAAPPLPRPLSTMMHPSPSHRVAVENEFRRHSDNGHLRRQSFPENNYHVDWTRFQDRVLPPATWGYAQERPPTGGTLKVANPDPPSEWGSSARSDVSTNVSWSSNVAVAVVEAR